MKIKTAVNILLIIALVVLASLNAYATCTVTLDKTSYFVNESPLATMVCDAGNEASKTYTLTWFNGSTTLDTDTGMTPPGTGTEFFQTFDINTTYSAGSVNLTGTNLEGSTTFTSTVAPANTLLVENIGVPGNLLLGRGGCVHFDLFLDSTTVNDGRCFIDSHNTAGFPVKSSDQIVTYNGHATFCGELDINFFTEDSQFASDINCFFKNTTLDRGATGAFFFNVTHWLLVNTLTDKSNYVLSDNQVLVCANLTNEGTERVPVEIVYNYRCDGQDNDTDRIIADTHIELRGISANTTQNQCAALQIKNLQTMTNKVNVCYGATDVRVLNTGGLRTDIYKTYSTTSPSFNITSNSGAVFVEAGDNMGSLAITIFILFVAGGLFALPFIIRQFTENDFANLVLKRSCWVIAIYLMMLNSAIMATIANFMGIDLTREMFRYMWLFGIAGYVSMGALVLKTLFDTLSLYKIKKTNERTG